MSYYGTHENRVSERTCPMCGKSHPHDWFVPDSIACWKCRAIKRDQTASGKAGAVKRNGHDELIG